MTEGGRPATLDIESLISTRLLLQANSGGGKSYALRKMIEEAFGKVQIILLDIEGEFATLREKYDFFLIGSSQHGADLPINLKIAAILPKRLLELQASTIIDMSELKAHERILFVKRFLEALVNLPKELWHPVVVVLDEAHIFCPQKEKSESAGAVIDLASRGRKRGQCLWAATQRISKLNKDVAAECNNKLIGRASLDVDMKRASEEIGFTTKEDMRSLRELNAGEFFAFGPALAKGVNKIQIDPVKTTHPKAGARILQVATPTPQRVKQLIGKLADLPTEAEHREKTEAELKRDNASLRGQLLAAENKIKKLEVTGGKERIIEKQVPVMPQEIKKELEKIRAALDRIDVGREIVSHHQTPALPSAILQDRPTGSAQKRILDSLARLNGAGIERVPKSMLAGFAQMRPTSGHFTNMLGNLRTSGLITYPQPGTISLTPEGLASIDAPDKPATEQELRQNWLNIMAGAQRRILEVVLDNHPQPISKIELAERAGMQSSSGHFTNMLGGLRTLGAIDYPSPGMVAATDNMFLRSK